MKLKLFDRGSVNRLTILVLIIAAILLFGWSLMIWMPGESYRQALPTLSAAELKFQDSLKSDVETAYKNLGKPDLTPRYKFETLQS